MKLYIQQTSLPETSAPSVGSQWKVGVQWTLVISRGGCHPVDVAVCVYFPSIAWPWPSVAAEHPSQIASGGRLRFVLRQAAGVALSEIHAGGRGQSHVWLVQVRTESVCVCVCVFLLYSFTQHLFQGCPHSLEKCGIYPGLDKYGKIFVFPDVQ